MNAKTLATPLTTPARSRLRLSLDRFGLPLVFILLCVVMAFSSEYFMTWRNWMDILRQTSINGILAVGMTYVILTKGIDLSVGSILAFAGLCSALVATLDKDRDATMKAAEQHDAAGERLLGLLTHHLDDEEDLIIPLILDRGEGPLGLA